MTSASVILLLGAIATLLGAMHVLTDIEDYVCCAPDSDWYTQMYASAAVQGAGALVVSALILGLHRGSNRARQAVIALITVRAMFFVAVVAEVLPYGVVPIPLVTVARAPADPGMVLDELVFLWLVADFGLMLAVPALLTAKPQVKAYFRR